ncbi:MAG TPA: c-type cytochrome [Gemmatimonadaceae bacterium]|nr:c-type cytochrome [Gemmatimonadaceae bacterium]
MSRLWYVLPCLTVVGAAVAATHDGQASAQVTADTLRFVAHAEYIPVGMPSRARPLALRNPFEGNRDAIATGARIFVAYNCVDCHGADGSGAMGPSFQDGRWRFGGSASEVFESIYQGRPEGMPAWGGRISEEQIWMLVAYVRSLTGPDLTTENFSGAAQERMGH